MSKSGQRLQDEGSRLQVVTAGAISGLVSRFVIAPLDVVKIRLQLQAHSLSDPLSQAELTKGAPIYKGTLATARHILRNEGITGLWKGNVPAELLYVSYAAVQFTTYRTISMALNEVAGEKGMNKSAESFIAGAGAGAAATAVTYPLDLLRTRFAAQGTERIYSSLFKAIRDIKRDEGTRGFFRGIGPGLAQIIPYMGMFFAIYESLRIPLSQYNMPFAGGDATAGVIASVIAKTGIFPLDLVRKRIQVQGPTRAKYVHKNIPVYDRGAAKAIRMILAHEGVRGLYKGLTVSLFKAAPLSAVTVWTYERVLNFLTGKTLDGAEKRTIS